MPQITVDGQHVDFKPGDSIIQVATRADVEIPYYCWHPRLSVAANCRMCLVEVEGAPKLLPACQTDCREGMVVNTNNERVKDAQRAVHEFLLINHPIDCPICDQAGECKLQDYYMKYQHVEGRMGERKVNKPRLESLGPHVLYNAERCIVCTRCIRFMDEVAKDRQLGVFNRGDHCEIGTVDGVELDNPYSMNTVDVCPVGALTSTAFRFKQRVWNLKRSESVCSGCSRGCNTYIDQRASQVYRLLPRENDAVNQVWMCDDGRMTYNLANENRLQHCLTKLPKLNEGVEETLASAALERAQSLLAPIVEKGAGLAVVVSMHATCEEAYVVGKFSKNVLHAESITLLGYDDWAGDDILRTVDHNPNRAGVRQVFEGLGLALTGWQGLRESLESGSTKALVVIGHEFQNYDELAGWAEKLEVTLHVTHYRGALCEAAQVTLPSISWAENEGTWVNIDRRAQRLRPAFPPVADAEPSYAWLLELARRLGADLELPSVQSIRVQMAEEIESFAQMDLGHLGAEGRIMGQVEAPVNN